MYRVVGCRECGALWIVADRPETTGCPRCGKRHDFGSLHAFHEAEDEAAAKRARAGVLADRAGVGVPFADLDDVAAGQLDASIPDDATPRASGLDPEAIADAGERAVARPARRPSRRETVLAAVAALDRPTETEVVDYAAERDVPAEAAADLLRRLTRAGDVSESGGRYRRV